MFADLITTAAPTLAAHGHLLADAESGVKSLTDLISENVVPLVITIVALFALMASRKGEVSNVVTIALGAIIALCVLAMALPGVRESITNTVAGWFS